MTVRFSPRARRDLSDIWDYSARRWGDTQADVYVRQIQQAIVLLDHHPALGRPCPEVRLGYHKYPTGSHVVFYRLISDVIEVIRILHERMDADRRLRD